MEDELDLHRVNMAPQVSASQEKAAQVLSPLEQLSAKGMITPSTTSIGEFSNLFSQPPFHAVNHPLNPGLCNTFYMLPRDNNAHPIDMSSVCDIEHFPSFLLKQGKLQKQQDQVKQRSQNNNFQPRGRKQQMHSQSTQQLESIQLQYLETLYRQQSRLLQ
eukprot:13384241-Ditylum_brightwellii.AAC.1